MIILIVVSEVFVVSMFKEENVLFLGCDIVVFVILVVVVMVNLNVFVSCLSGDCVIIIYVGLIFIEVLDVDGVFEIFVLVMVMDV